MTPWLLPVVPMHPLRAHRIHRIALHVKRYFFSRLEGSSVALVNCRCQKAESGPQEAPGALLAVFIMLWELFGEMRVLIWVLVYSVHSRLLIDRDATRLYEDPGRVSTQRGRVN